MDIILMCLFAYLMGSISFAMIIGKGFFKKDLRKEGSGNLGTTNTFRVLGKKAGFAVALGDIVKGALPVLCVSWFDVDVHMIIPGIFAVIGHVYPVFFGFRGGKAVATTSGVVLAYSPILFLLFFCLFFIFLYLTKIVSLSSIFTALALTIASFWSEDTVFVFFCLVISAFVTYKHKTNIKRIIQKEEPKIKWL